jgi:Divergent polysaccharide deacetylase
LGNGLDALDEAASGATAAFLCVRCYPRRYPDAHPPKNCRIKLLIYLTNFDEFGPCSAVPAAAAPPEQKFAEMTSHGPVPKIAADGTRPADVFARPVKALAGRPGAPRVALIVAGLGVSTSATSTAIAQLPGPVTFAFMPYGAEVERLAALARSEGHEILLQVPMEPFNYPDSDPGPQTLLTSLTPEQNLERLYWLMSRMQGYVGLAEAMSAIPSYAILRRPPYPPRF